MSDVAGEKDGGHSAAADLAFHLITAGERSLQLIEKLHHVQLLERRRDGKDHRRRPMYPAVRYASTRLAAPRDQYQGGGSSTSVEGSLACQTPLRSPRSLR